MSDFDVFTDKGGAGRGSVENPTVRISAGKIHLGSITHEEILDGTERIEYLVGEDGRLGLRPIDADEERAPHSYSATGGDVSVTSVWNEMGVELDERHNIPVDTESESFPVIDVSGFIDEDDDAAVECEVCGRSFGNERGKNIHKAKSHDDEAERSDNDVSGFIDEDDDSEGPGADSTVLDHERISTALDSVGVAAEVSSEEFVRAVDANVTSYEVGKALDVSRADAADLILRLDLENALDSDDGRAVARFERGREEGAA